MNYAISDIHGCLKTLLALLQKIENNSINNTFYFLGDYIDRGPDSKAVLDYMINFRNHNNAHFIKGNHEQMMLNTYISGTIYDYSLWKQNGSEQTMHSFSVPSGAHDIKKYIPLMYIDFIESMPYYLELENFFLVHAGFNFNSDNPFTDTNSMLWTRFEENNTKFTNGKYIIHGHVPTSVEQIMLHLHEKRNILSIDSGCVYNQFNDLGKLSALNLDTMELIYTDNIDN